MKAFAAAKREGQQHYITIGLFQVLYWDVESRNGRLNRAVAERLRQLGKKRITQVIEDVILKPIK